MPSYRTKLQTLSWFLPHEQKYPINSGFFCHPSELIFSYYIPDRQIHSSYWVLRTGISSEIESLQGQLGSENHRQNEPVGIDSHSVGRACITSNYHSMVDSHTATNYHMNAWPAAVPVTPIVNQVYEAKFDRGTYNTMTTVEDNHPAHPLLLRHLS